MPAAWHSDGAGTGQNMNGETRGNGAPRAPGDWSRVLAVLSIVASVAAAAWYLDDRGLAKVTREADGLEQKLDRLERRVEQRLDEIALSVRELNGRLDRLLELELARRGSR